MRKVEGSPETEATRLPPIATSLAMMILILSSTMMILIYCFDDDLELSGLAQSMGMPVMQTIYLHYNEPKEKTWYASISTNRLYWWSVDQVEKQWGGIDVDLSKWNLKSVPWEDKRQSAINIGGVWNLAIIGLILKCRVHMYHWPCFATNDEGN